MKVLINRQPYELDESATLDDAIAMIQAKPPYAAAGNTQFVPRTQYRQHGLRDGDQIEIISPVTGG